MKIYNDILADLKSKLETMMNENIEFFENVCEQASLPG